MGSKALEFLVELRENNNRDWFKANKQYYEEARSEFISMIENLIPALAATSPLIGNLAVKDTVFRIYRDVRFSKDKSPYKIAFGAYMAPGGRKSMLPGHYFHIEPDNSFLAGGSHNPAGDRLKSIRSEIYYNSSEFNSIINASSFKKLFGELSGDKLVRPPIGFPKDFDDIELLKFKEYIVLHKIKDSVVTRPDFLNISVDIFEKMNPFIAFLNRALRS
jgi:uncharacterized protein (TIGR02453 family)